MLVPHYRKFQDVFRPYLGSSFGRAIARSSGKKRIGRICRYRTGVATLEFAIVAPIFFMVVLALIQFSGILMSQNVLTQAAREGARYASLPQTLTAQEVEDKVAEYLRSGGIDPNQVTIILDPQMLDVLESGDDVTVSVSAPMHEITFMGQMIPTSLSLEAQFVCKRE